MPGAQFRGDVLHCSRTGTHFKRQARSRNRGFAGTGWQGKSPNLRLRVANARRNRSSQSPPTLRRDRRRRRMFAALRTGARRDRVRPAPAYLIPGSACRECASTPAPTAQRGGLFSAVRAGKSRVPLPRRPRKSRQIKWLNGAPGLAGPPLACRLMNDNYPVRKMNTRVTRGLGLAVPTMSESPASLRDAGRALRALPPGPALELNPRPLRAHLARGLKFAAGAIVGFGVIVSVLHLVP